MRDRQSDGVRDLLSKVETALAGGNRDAFLAISTLDASSPDVAPFLNRWFTRQTTRGTQQAAGSIRELAAVAQELKSSVAGFKL